MSNPRSDPTLQGHSSIQSSTTSTNVQGDYHDASGPRSTNNSDSISDKNLHEDYTKILECLYTSQYQSHWRRVPEPVKGTCSWVTDHPKYREWLGNKTLGLLWLSADPGSGKSVISSFLISHLKNQLDAVVCYFFFKDDSEEQRSTKFALCAILHQLFVQRKSLCKYAEGSFKDKGRSFTEEVDTLWGILVKAVADVECGEVICVVDGLDECEESTLTPLIRHIIHLQRSGAPDVPLKFLMTSRPYHRIEKEVGSPATTIRLRGEDEINAITTDVTRVIDKGITDLETYWGRPGALEYLRELLMSSADRTFLWVSLVLEVLKESVDDSPEGFIHLVSTAPRDLAELYTMILNKSKDPDQTRRILHIVVAATRPLTTREIYVLFRIRLHHTTIRDLGELSRGSEATIKELCGLFVQIIDSKVYLVHQTAKEFLIKGSESGQGGWQYSISFEDSSFILADGCISYLALEDTENEVPEIGTYRNDRLGGVFDYALLEYAASNWAMHFQDSGDRQMELFDRTKLICKRGSRYMTWFRLYWRNTVQYYPFPNDFTHLMIASWLGQRTVIERLLDEGEDINVQSKKYGTALNIAALRKDWHISKMLLERNAKVYIRGKEYNILHKVYQFNFIGGR